MSPIHSNTIRSLCTSILAAAYTSACGPSRLAPRPITETCFGVELKANTGPLRFEFLNARTGAPVTAQDVGVIRLTDDGEDVAGVCGIASNTGLVTDWTYGTVPVGYERKGSCAALVPGKYRLVAHGDGSAARMFLIDGAGKASWLQATCQ